MSNKKPMILVLAGPNGSGKSTITQYFEMVYNKTLGGVLNDVETIKLVWINRKSFYKYKKELLAGSKFQ